MRITDFFGRGTGLRLTQLALQVSFTEDGLAEWIVPSGMGNRRLVTATEVGDGAYELQRSRDGGAYETVPLPLDLEPGDSLRVIVEAVASDRYSVLLEERGAGAHTVPIPVYIGVPGAPLAGGGADPDVEYGGEGVEYGGEEVNY